MNRDQCSHALPKASGRATRTAPAIGGHPLRRIGTGCVTVGEVFADWLPCWKILDSLVPHRTRFSTSVSPLLPAAAGGHWESIFRSMERCEAFCNAGEESSATRDQHAPVSALPGWYCAVRLPFTAFLETSPMSPVWRRIRGGRNDRGIRRDRVGCHDCRPNGWPPLLCVAVGRSARRRRGRDGLGVEFVMSHSG